MLLYILKGTKMQDESKDFIKESRNKDILPVDDGFNNISKLSFNHTQSPPYRYDNDSIKESPKQEEIAIARKGLRKYFYYRETNRLGAVFISIALALLFVVPLFNTHITIKTLMLGIIIFSFLIYTILRKVVAYQPFLFLFLLYLLCFLFFLILWVILGVSHSLEKTWGYIVIFAILFLIFFILGNIKYHDESFPYVMMMVLLIVIFFVI